MRWFVTLLLGFAGFTGSALATPVIHFHIPGGSGGGDITWGGGTAPLIGSNIKVDTIQGVGTGLHSGDTLNCLNCTLWFNTGIYSGSGQFHGGGSFVITGQVDMNGNGFSMLDPADISGPILWSGFLGTHFDDPPYNPLVLNLPNGWKELFAPLTDQENGKLLDYFGLPDGVMPGALTALYTSSHFPADSCTGPGCPDRSCGRNNILGLSLDNTVADVPEPASIMMLGSGLIGLAGMARRRLLKKV